MCQGLALSCHGRRNGSEVSVRSCRRDDMQRDRKGAGRAELRLCGAPETTLGLVLPVAAGAPKLQISLW